MDGVTYSGSRPHLLTFFDPTGKSVLDVGCGGGGLGSHLRKAGAASLTGVEPSPAAAALASDVYDRVHCTEVETLLDDSLLGTERFGLILLADVLEHLVDPWRCLADLVDSHLAPDGQVFISVPNVANIATIKQLVLRRDWRYDESGLFDRTHLRWFGSKSTRSLLDQAGLDVATWGGRVRFDLGPIHINRICADVSRVPAVAVFQFHCLATRRP